MKFDFVIGNPPYQDNHTSNDHNFSAPIYHFFMDAAFNVATKVELITPARFLFNAGATPKKWNDKMLSDQHFKVLRYAQNSETVFPGIGIAGGGRNLLPWLYTDVRTYNQVYCSQRACFYLR